MQCVVTKGGAAGGGAARAEVEKMLMRRMGRGNMVDCGVAAVVGDFQRFCVRSG